MRESVAGLVFELISVRKDAKQVSFSTQHFCVFADKLAF